MQERSSGNSLGSESRVLQDVRASSPMPQKKHWILGKGIIEPRYWQLCRKLQGCSGEASTMLGWDFHHLWVTPVPGRNPSAMLSVPYLSWAYLHSPLSRKSQESLKLLKHAFCLSPSQTHCCCCCWLFTFLRGLISFYGTLVKKVSHALLH